MKSAILICVTFFASTFAKDGGSLSIVSELGSVHGVKSPGEAVSLPCTVVGSDFDPWNNVIQWSKITAEGEEISINTNSAVNEPFLVTGRYSISRETEPGTVRITLNIRNISVADNGTYQCVLKDASTVLSVMEHELMVPAPIADLILTTNNSRTEPDGNVTHTIFEFEKLKPAFVSCVSKGGNPMPSLKIYRGRVEVTDEFEQNIIETRLGQKGLEEVRYEIQLVKADFMAISEYSGHNLKCMSKVPRSGRADKMPVHKQTRTATMEVTFPPEFECSREWAAFVATEQFAIKCDVHANPQVDMDALAWHVGDGENATEINVGDSVNGLSANVSVDRATSKLMVSLTIDSVNTTHFQRYVLRARNNLGERHFNAVLSLATTSSSTTTSATPAKDIKGNNNPPYKAEESKPMMTTGGAVHVQATVHSLLVTVFSLPLLTTLMQF